MTLYEQWTSRAYDKSGKAVKAFWDKYLPEEQKIYEDLIGNKQNRISGSVAGLAEKYGMEPECVCGFMDGIHDALNEDVEVKELALDSQLDVSFEFDALFKKMAEYKAEHLYTLPQWDAMYSPEDKERLIKEQRTSKTYVRETEKIGRNDPCPCGSGKKYKKCCGAAQTE
ncbi:MAG: SEC-C metal-binding domain-containing protein [Defluviitaleaceae bacterium]|nr:SEC-C metal-binding domain-containing protein [Defluviitaleaceae bacterium]